MTQFLADTYPILAPGMGALTTLIACRGYYHRQLAEAAARTRRVHEAAIAKGIEAFRSGFHAGLHMAPRARSGGDPSRN